jgi:hypothetical protein
MRDVSLKAPAPPPGLSLTLCASAGTEPGGKCGVGRLVTTRPARLGCASPGPSHHATSPRPEKSRVRLPTRRGVRSRPGAIRWTASVDDAANATRRAVVCQISEQPIGAGVSYIGMKPLRGVTIQCPSIQSTIPSTGSTALRKLALSRSRWTIPKPSAQCSKMPMITSGSPKEPENEQQAAGQSQSSCSIRGNCARVGRNGLHNKQGAPYSASCVQGCSYHSSLIVMT